MGENHKYFKYLADGARPVKGVPNPATIARINALSKSVAKLAQPSTAWKPSYLVSKPTFWSGMGDAFNVYGYFKPKFRFRNPHRVDAQALREDWAAVGADLERVLKRFERTRELSDQARLFDPAKLDKGA